MQHMSYPAQLRWKRTQVVDALTRLGGVADADARTLPTIGMAEPFAYRHKASMSVRAEGIGFYARDSHALVDFKECRIQHPAGPAVRSVVRAWMAREGVPAYDDLKQTGWLRHVVVRTSRSTGEVMVILVLASHDLADPHGRPLLPGLDRLSLELEQALEACGTRLAGLVLNAQPLQGALILGDRYLCAHGRDFIEETIDGLTFRLSPASFFQINPDQAAQLYRIAAEWAVEPETGTDTVYDLYCGTGTISCFLARRAKRVVGIEHEPAAVADAVANAERNGLSDRATFIEGRAELVLGDVAAALGDAEQPGAAPRIPTVVLDPPRRGCDPALLDTLILLQPDRIVYVSCDPSTLARDVRKLTEGGYRVEKVQPVDMFPWTEHVESVVLMSK